MADQYGNPVRRTDQYGHPAVNHGALAEDMGPYGGGTNATGYDQTGAAGHGAHPQQGLGTGGMTTGGGLGTGMGTGGHGTGGFGTGVGGHGGLDTGGQQQQQRGGVFSSKPHRSGNSSSSSSEDDGEGGRRKKGMKEKIKEKFPGGHKDEQYQGQQGYTTTAPGAAPGQYGTQQQQYHDPNEKKGVADKIKEKFPGGNKDEQPHRGDGYTTATPGATAAVPGQGYTKTAPGAAPGHHGTQQQYQDPNEKKGMMDKIKEKFPGGPKDEQPHQGHGHTTAAPGTTTTAPGHYGTQQQQQHHNTTETAPGQYGTTQQQHHNTNTTEKKGIMDKIKDKIPGSHNK